MDASLELLLGKIAETVEFLELEGVGVNARGVFDNAPLHVVISWHDYAAIKTLIDGGADVNAMGEDDFTPLHKAIMMKNVRAVEILLSHGANPEIKNDDGDDAVRLARKVGDVKIIETLQSGLEDNGSRFRFVRACPSR